jgi:hypothetical protein
MLRLLQTGDRQEKGEKTGDPLLYLVAAVERKKLKCLMSRNALS